MAIAGSGLVPLDHLEFLIRKHAASKAEGKALGAKVVGGPAEREQVMLRLDKLAPGTKSRLIDAWRTQGSNAVHLWRLPWATELTGSDAVTSIGKTLGIKLTGSRVCEIAGALTNSGQTRILRLQVDDDVLRATVRRASTRRWTFEGAEATDLVSTDVDLVLQFDGSGILEVYATHTNAKPAAETIIEAAFDRAIPAKPKERLKVLVPVVFKEAHILALRRKLGMRQTSMTGPDALDEFGEVRYKGKGSGHLPAPLEPVAREAKQNASYNYIREYRMNFEHDDGFELEFGVEFYLKSTHPHLKFKTKTSRPAARHVINELCALVGVKP